MARTRAAAILARRAVVAVGLTTVLLMTPSSALAGPPPVPGGAISALPAWLDVNSVEGIVTMVVAVVTLVGSAAAAVRTRFRVELAVTSRPHEERPGSRVVTLTNSGRWSGRDVRLLWQRAGEDAWLYVVHRNPFPLASGVQPGAPFSFEVDLAPLSWDEVVTTVEWARWWRRKARKTLTVSDVV